MLALAAASAVIAWSRSARADEPLAGYDPDSGAYLRTLDGAWLFNPYAMVQLRHATTFERGDVAATGFDLHAAKVIFHGHIYDPRVTYHLQVNFGDGKTVAEDLYLRVDPRSEYGVLVGQIEVPFNRQHITLEAYQQLVDRSIVDQRFSLRRDMGVVGYAADEPHRFELTAGLFNGSGQNAPNDDRTYLETLRLAYNPWGPIPFREADLDDSPRPKLSIATAIAYNPRRVVTDGSKTTTSTHILQGVGETTLRYRGLSLTTEAHLREQDVAGVQRRDGGAFIQAGFFVVPRHVEIAGRVAYVAGDLAPAETNAEQTLGATWYLRGHRLKLGLEGSRLELRAAPSAHRARVQLEFFL